MEKSNEITRKKKSPKKDRSGSKYSEEAFLALPRDKQLALANKYWLGHVKNFDDGTFKFSRDKFISLCKSLGFREAIIDTQTNVSTFDTIYIDRGRRADTTERKFTLNTETDALINEYFSTGECKLTNTEKSKIFDSIILSAFTELLDAQKNGQTTVAYRPAGEERLL